jgi:hypothetical protein
MTLPPLRPQAPATRVLLSHFRYAGDSHDQDRYARLRLGDEGLTLLLTTRSSREPGLSP